MDWINFPRISDSLPSLHDEVLAAAVKAAMSVSSDSKKKQVWRFDTISFSLFMLYDCDILYFLLSACLWNYREVVLTFWVVLLKDLRVENPIMQHLFLPLSNLI